MSDVLLTVLNKKQNRDPVLNSYGTNQAHISTFLWESNDAIRIVS